MLSHILTKLLWLDFNITVYFKFCYSLPNITRTPRKKLHRELASGTMKGHQGQITRTPRKKIASGSNLLMKTGWILWNQEPISADRPSSSGTMKAIRRPSTECECRWLGSPVDFLLMNSRQINREKKIYLFVASFPHRCSPSSFLETKEFILQWCKSSDKETRLLLISWKVCIWLSI